MFFFTEQDTEYIVKIKDGDKEIDEEIKIDTEKQTETVIVPETDFGNAGEVKVVYDFEKVKYNVKKWRNSIVHWL